MSDSPNGDQFNAPSPTTRPKAIVYAEGNFGGIDEKTANGLVRHSERYEIVSVIDSRFTGQDTGVVLDGKPNGIPVCRDLDDALAGADEMPELFIIGVAPTSALLSSSERSVLLDAIGRGLNLVNGLREFLNDDPEFASAAAINDVAIVDVRRPRAKVDLRMFSGAIHDVTCPRIAVLGTDGAIGRRTTATVLTRVLNAHGVKAVLVAPGRPA